jgi:hypothetical protein
MSAQVRPLLARFAASLAARPFSDRRDTNAQEYPIYESLLVSRDLASQRETRITRVERETTDDQ